MFLLETKTKKGILSEGSLLQLKRLKVSLLMPYLCYAAIIVWDVLLCCIILLDAIVNEEHRVWFEYCFLDTFGHCLRFEIIMAVAFFFMA
jgi:hypothetical protein